MSNIRKNAIAFLQKRFPAAPVQELEYAVNDSNKKVVRIWFLIALDPQAGVKQRAIAVENLGSKVDLFAIAKSMTEIFNNMDSSIYISIGNVLDPSGHDIDTNQMAYAPRVILYTNKLMIPIQQVIQAFDSVDTLIDIVDESKMHKTLFISYGGPDKSDVSKINKRIKSKGVQTWFFPDDASPGEKLHRVMHDGVNNYDRVLLICSKNSLTRAGVLNEIERVLEREAKEGGTDILIPVTLDDYVYGEWAPERSDLASQVRSRVITKLDTKSENFDIAVEKVVDVLKGK